LNGFPTQIDTACYSNKSSFPNFAIKPFLLIAARNPVAHRSVIAFAAWSSVAHAVTMSIQGLEIPSQRTGFLGGSAVPVVIGVALIALAPARKALGQTSAVAA
jgi:hypothetical protein